MNSGLSRCTEIQDRRIQQKLSVEGRISKSSCNCAFLSTAWTQRLQTSLANHSKYELQLDQQESSRSNQLMWVFVGKKRMSWLCTWEQHTRLPRTERAGAEGDFPLPSSIAAGQVVSVEQTASGAIVPTCQNVCYHFS